MINLNIFLSSAARDSAVLPSLLGVGCVAPSGGSLLGLVRVTAVVVVSET